jgi:ketosteroid isomerase-like protein
MTERQTAHTPEEVHAVLEDVFTRGDVDAYLAMHEADATVVVPPEGHHLHGPDAIRAAIEPLFAMGPRLTSTVRMVVQNGNLAMTHARWDLVGTAPDGATVRLAGNGTIVSRRRPDGTWGIVFDNPLSPTT